MSEVTLRFRVGGHPAADWAAANPVLLDREIGLETDTGLIRFGNGSNGWNTLPEIAVNWARVLNKPTTLAGYGITGVTGTGDVVLKNSPTVVTPTFSGNTIVTGNTNPTSMTVQADGNGGAAAAQHILQSFGTAQGTSFVVRLARGSLATPSNVNNGDRVGSFLFMGYGGGNWRTIAGLEVIVGTGTVSATSMPSSMALATTPDGAVTRVNRWRVTQDGHLLSENDGAYDFGSASKRIRQTNTQGVALGIRTVTGTATATVADYTILANAAAGALTINLPAAAANLGMVLVVKKIDDQPNAVTIDPNGTETLDGAATRDITSQWSSLMIQSNGTGWFIL